MTAVATNERDLREGGRWTPLQRAKNEAIYGLVVMTLAVMARLPARIVVALGRIVGRLCHAVLVGPRRTARANMAAAFPDEPVEAHAVRARACFLRLGEYLGDAVLALSGRRSVATLSIDEASLAVLEAARSEGRGVLLLSAHLGPWERVAEALAAHAPFVAISRSAYDPRLSKVLETMRTALGVACIPRDGRFAGLKLLRALKKGAVVGVPIDLATRAASVTVPWFERPARVPRGAIDLALRTDAVIVIATAAPCATSASGLHVTIERLDVALARRPDEGAPSVEEWAAAAARVLCARIRAFPEGWPFMHPRFHDPAR